MNHNAFANEHHSRIAMFIGGVHDASRLMLKQAFRIDIADIQVNGDGKKGMCVLEYYVPVST